MLTESFLNSCFTLLLNETAKVRRDKSLYRDVLEIINFYKKKEKDNIPISVKLKVECLSNVCKMKLEDKTTDSIIDSIIVSDKYKHLSDFLHLKAFESIKDSITADCIRQIRLRKQLNSLFKNYDELSKFLNTIKDGSFESIDNVVSDYEQIIKTLYSNFMENSRSIAMEASASLDFAQDDFSTVLNTILTKYKVDETTPTGFPILDTNVLRGGFEKSRLYVFGGGSGSGKSTLLNNFIANAASGTSDVIFRSDFDINESTKTKSEKDVYIYVTLENTIEESLLRIYQSLYCKTIDEAIEDIKNGVDIKKRLLDKMAENNSTIIMKYFKPMSISVLDLMMVLDDAVSLYGKDSIKGLYVDYLDLLSGDMKYDLYRIELGQITLSLKALAVDYNIPVITVTQLGRGAYRVTESRNLNLDQISESIKKVEHADFIGLLIVDTVDTTIVHFKDAKNRGGKSNVNMDFKVNFANYKFISGQFVSNIEKKDSATQDQMFFGTAGY